MNATATIRPNSLMRLGPTVFTAAAAAIAGFIRLAMGTDVNWVAANDQATPIPPITEKLVEQYAFAGATDQEIADRFLIEVDELRRHYTHVIRVARAMHLITVRSSQFQTAKKLNSSMLIWLGRNELGQKANGPGTDEKMPGIETDAL